MAIDRPDNRSLGDLFAELSREIGTLVRKEVELAKVELTANFRKAGTDAGLTAAGGALAHAGLLIVLAALVLGLADLGVPAWLSAVIVGIATIAIGYMLVNRGLTNLRQTHVAPTVDVLPPGVSLQDDRLSVNIHSVLTAYDASFMLISWNVSRSALRRGR